MQNSILIIFTIFSIAFSGTTVDFEEQLFTLLSKLKYTENQLDSLESRLYNLKLIIDNAKEEEKNNKTKLALWFEEVKQISDSIAIQKKSIQLIEEDISSARIKLDIEYKRLLDSLQSVLDKQDDSNNRKVIEEQIFQLTEKRILNSAPFPLLSFNPQKVKDIQLNQVADSVEYRIYVDYLNSAKAEVIHLLQSIQKTEHELKEMIILQQRKNRFLEEIDEDRSMLFYSQLPVEISSDWTYGKGDRTVTGEVYTFQTQVNSLAQIMDQLTTDNFNLIDDNWVSKVVADQAYLSMDNYINMLEDAEGLLQHYLENINRKIEESD